MLFCEEMSNELFFQPDDIDTLKKKVILVQVLQKWKLSLHNTIYTLIQDPLELNEHVCKMASSSTGVFGGSVEQS